MIHNGEESKTDVDGIEAPSASRDDWPLLKVAVQLWLAHSPAQSPPSVPSPTSLQLPLIVITQRQCSAPPWHCCSNMCRRQALGMADSSLPGENRWRRPAELGIHPPTSSALFPAGGSLGLAAAGDAAESD